MGETLESWLAEFKPGTAKTYLYALKSFKKAVGIDDLGDYLRRSPDALADFKKFAKSLEERPKKTVMTYTGAVKVFLRDHEIDLPSHEIAKLRRRGRLPRRARATTKDKIPNKAQMKSILNYMDVKGRAITLFLVSSGCRIGETLKIRLDDLDLDSEPPSARIRDDYTKGGESGRTVYMSYEARDAIRDWLKARGGLKKRSGEGTYESHLLFPFGPNNARGMWNRACEKAKIQLRDVETDRRLYHLHSLRKFFRTNIGLKPDFTHALMGHLEYLDESYLRSEQGEIAQSYLENMERVSFYGMEDAELKRTVEDMQAEIERMRGVVRRFVGRPPEELERMTDWWEQHKWDKEIQEAEDADYRALKSGKLDLKAESRWEALVNPEYKEIDESELIKYLNDGWGLKHSLNNGSHKVIVERIA